MQVRTRGPGGRSLWPGFRGGTPWPPSGGGVQGADAPGREPMNPAGVTIPAKWIAAARRRAGDEAWLLDPARLIDDGWELVDQAGDGTELTLRRLQGAGNTS